MTNKKIWIHFPHFFHIMTLQSWGYDAKKCRSTNCCCSLWRSRFEFCTTFVIPAEPGEQMPSKDSILSTEMISRPAQGAQVSSALVQSRKSEVQAEIDGISNKPTKRNKGLYVHNNNLCFLVFKGLLQPSWQFSTFNRLHCFCSNFKSFENFAKFNKKHVTKIHSICILI